VARSADKYQSVYGGKTVSIIRIGLAETKGFAGGYDAIFGGKKTEAKAPAKKVKKKAKKKTPSAKK
jgi:hypothetical protein